MLFLFLVLITPFYDIAECYVGDDDDKRFSNYLFQSGFFRYPVNGYTYVKQYIYVCELIYAYDTKLLDLTDFYLFSPLLYHKLLLYDGYHNSIIRAASVCMAI